MEGIKNRTTERGLKRAKIPIETKEYDLKIEEEKYKLKIAIYQEPIIKFHIRQTNKISTCYYEKEYAYNEMTTILKLANAHYNDISKVLKFIDTAIIKEKIKLIDKRPESHIILYMKRELDFDIIESNIILEEREIEQKEMMKILAEEINNLTTKQMNVENKSKIEINQKEQRIAKLEEKVNLLEEEKEKQKAIICTIKKENAKENEENKKEIQRLRNEINEIRVKDKKETDMEIKKLKEENELRIKEKQEKEEEIARLKEVNIKMEKERQDIWKEITKIKEVNVANEKAIKENKQYIENLKKEQKKLEEFKKREEDRIKEEQLLVKQKIYFKENPCGLIYIEDIANNNSCSGWLYNFVIFNGLKDDIEYIAYNNSYNIEIKRIKDKVRIISLKGHNNKTTVIRYYRKENKEEYILSCDLNILVIIWDIQNNYNKKYNFELKYSGYISDALLLFNIINKDYILISRDNKGEYSKLYEFKDNTPYIRNIYGTNENETYFMIPWTYKNKYYIIECCKYKISINNILEDEYYGKLTKDPEGRHFCGYIYNDNYLCVSDNDNNYIRIWDLMNKVIYKQIKYDGYGREIIPWNKKYIIVGSSGGIVIIDIEEGREVNKIKLDTFVSGVKKKKLRGRGESLIIS